MNFKSRVENNSENIKFRVSIVMILLLTALAIFPQLQYAQAKLSLGDIFTALRSKKATLEERNKLLTEAIKVRGITFSLTTIIERELEETGADEELIQAIRQKSEIVKVVATPMPTPVATPIPTPIPTPELPTFEIYQKRGDSSFVKGEYDSAVINYSKAIDLNPQESSIYLSRGLVYYNRKFYDLAIADYSKVIEIDPKEMMAYYYRGDSHEKLGELQKAADDFKKVLEFDSSNENAKTALERLESLLSKSKPKEAASQPTLNETPRESAKQVETAKTTTTIPEFAELGSLVGFADKLVQPVYPPNLRSMRIEGEVMVNITLDEEGNPIAVKAVSGHPLLRQVCEESIKKSKFKPATFNNQPTKAKGFVTFKFRL